MSLQLVADRGIRRGAGGVRLRRRTAIFATTLLPLTKCSVCLLEDRVVPAPVAEYGKRVPFLAVLLRGGVRLDSENMAPR